METNISETAHETAAAEKRGVPMWAQVLIWTVLIGLLAMLAIGLRRTQQGTVQPGEKAPDFSLPMFSGYSYEGKTDVRLSDMRGKVVVINFWASWCKPCEQEAADLEAAWREYEPTGKVMFIGVDYVDTEPEARAYLKKFDITYPNGADLGTRISQAYRIKGVPETFFIDAEGVLRYVKIGPFTSLREIKAVIDPMLP